MNIDTTIASAVITCAVALAAIVVSYQHNKKQQELANSQIFKELFHDFNSRYNELNGELSKIATSMKNIDFQISESERAIIIDYFNLCAEEFYWFYYKKRVCDVIWNSWKNGMRYYYELNGIKKIWEDEIASYENGVAYYLPEHIKKDNIKFFHEIQ